MLPEWAPQSATLLVWPHKDTDWEPWLADICSTYVEFASAITRHQPLLIVCKDKDHEAEIRKQLTTHSHPIYYLNAPYNDTWCRDYAPIAVQDSLLDFRFNGWGDKYDAQNDDQLSKVIHQQGIFSLPLKPLEFQLEGGSIDTNGNGLLLTTEACLLSGTRNKNLSKSSIEKTLLQTLNCKKVLWLTKGQLIGDDTDSHVDNLARFVTKNTVVYAASFSSDDIHHEPLNAMEEELRSINNDQNLGLTLIPIPIPEPQHDPSTGSQLPGSYINFVFVNGAVIVPVFGVPQDEFALSTFKTLFPTREIIPLTGNHLIKQFGGPHCASMQFPTGTINIDRM